MRAIIFDMDGVIVDSEYTYITAIRTILESFGYDVKDEYLYSFLGTTHVHTWTTIKTDYYLPESVNNYIEQMFTIRELIIEKDGLIPINNVQEFINDCHAKGFKLAVASSSPKDEIIRTVQSLEIDSYFLHLISGEEVKYSKPAPDIFLKAAELLHVEPEDCIVIEDSTNGANAAKSAGMYCIGYRNSKYPLQDLRMTDEIIDDFREIDIT